MSIFVAALLIASSLFGLTAPKIAKVETGDLQRLTGAKWTGTLTYADYRTNKPTAIKSNLTVTRSAANKKAWVFEYEYPDGPKANSKDTVTLGKNGATIDGEKVIERTRLPDGGLRIVTEEIGPDNNRNALFRFTYSVGAKNLSIKKEVRYDGTTEFFERNRYVWSR